MDGIKFEKITFKTIFCTMYKLGSPLYRDTMYNLGSPLYRDTMYNLGSPVKGKKRRGGGAYRVKGTVHRFYMGGPGNRLQLRHTVFF